MIRFNTASDYLKQQIGKARYDYWSNYEAVPPQGIPQPASNIISPSSTNFQRFRTFEDRYSALEGQRQCTTFCPISYYTLPPLIESSTIPPIPVNAARITFDTVFTTIPTSPPTIQILGNTSFSFTAHLGINQNKQVGNTSGSNVAGYTIINTYLNYTNQVYLDITSNVAAIHSVLYRRGGIRNILNLKAMFNLHELIADDNNISNLSQISSNIAMNTLYLRNNNIVSLSPLSTLTLIKYLYLSKNSITTLDGIQTMTQLEDIDLEYNMLTSIPQLSAKTALKSINVANNQITDLSPLSSSSNIIYLYAENNQITSVNPLLSMTKLSRIYLGGNVIVDINPLLIMLAAGTTTNGILNATYQQTALSLTVLGQTAYNILIGRGWVIQI